LFLLRRLLWIRKGKAYTQQRAATRYCGYRSQRRSARAFPLLQRVGLEICALIVNRDCLSDQIHRPFGLTRIVGDHAKKMQTVCMIGFDCEDSSTEAGGLFEPTGSKRRRC
jgi:hypothetical protein